MVETFFLSFLTSVTATYAAVASLLVIGLLRLRGKRTPRDERDLPRISIIVAARNESANIDVCLDALIAQDYPLDRYEILLIDDYSDDDTLEKAVTLAERHPPLRVLALRDLGDPEITGKQHALDFGIRQSRGEIIASTDADCRPPRTWLRALAERFDANTGVVVGFSMLDDAGDGSRPFVKVQSLELLGLFSSFAASLGWRLAFACTGNNLAYRRAAYEELGGFMKMGFTVAEDNMFLQWVNRHTDWEIRVACAPEATVRTNPMPTFRAFLDQRLRWASNSLENRLSAVWFMVVAYGVNLLIPVAVVASLLGFGSLTWALALVALKLLPEWALLWRGLGLFGRRDLLAYLLPLAPFHTCYVLIAGIVGLTGKVTWKGRSHRMQRKR